jgi:hypothetical protein
VVRRVSGHRSAERSVERSSKPMLPVGTDSERERVGRAPGAARRSVKLRDITAGGQPAIGQCLLDDHANSGCVGLAKRGTRRGLQQVPRRLHGVKAANLECPFDRLRLSGSSDREPDRDPAGSHLASSSSTARSSRTPLSSVAEWIW